MILYLFVVFLLLSQGVFADQSENYPVRNTHWGMTPEEVKQKEKKTSWKKIVDADSLICYKGTWDTGIEGKVCYGFRYNRLISLEYEIQGDLKRYHLIHYKLQEKYNITTGSPWIIHEGQTRLSLIHHKGTIEISYESTEHEKVDGIIDDL